MNASARTETNQQPGLGAAIRQDNSVISSLVLHKQRLVAARTAMAFLKKEVKLRSSGSYGLTEVRTWGFSGSRNTTAC